jgi:hypothetical protein
MANIQLTELTIDPALATESDCSIRDLSAPELALQGGKRRSNPPILPPPIVGGGPAPFDPGIPPFLPGFYI